mmetsp:Transcript_2533/g.4290  ORF Transcript_2533/g.4290 Transcript_2533/m.4290 type:complete len:289 (+) Transcript_2533:90-956(+)
MGAWSGAAEGAGPGQYDVDFGGKASLSTSVSGSPQRYSVMRSSANRFANTTGGHSPGPIYNIDHAHKQTMESAARDNHRFYSACFHSKTNRFGRPWTAPVYSDTLRDVTRTMNDSPATIARAAEVTPHKYHILHSKHQRFSNVQTSEAADRIYDVDSGNKTSMFTAMVNSPITYRNMGALPSDDTRRKAHQHGNSHGDLGPGSYDFLAPPDVGHSPYIAARPLSSMMSHTSRFGRSRGGTSGLGSTWTNEKDVKNWAANSFSIPKAEYLRPQYMPKIFLDKQKADFNS